MPTKKGNLEHIKLVLENAARVSFGNEQRLLRAWVALLGPQPTTHKFDALAELDTLGKNQSDLFVVLWYAPQFRSIVEELRGAHQKSELAKNAVGKLQAHSAVVEAKTQQLEKPLANEAAGFVSLRPHLLELSDALDVFIETYKEVKSSLESSEDTPNTILDAACKVLARGADKIAESRLKSHDDSTAEVHKFVQRFDGQIRTLRCERDPLPPEMQGFLNAINFISTCVEFVDAFVRAKNAQPDKLDTHLPGLLELHHRASSDQESLREDVEAIMH